MHSISIKRTWFATLLAIIFLGVGLAEATPLERGQSTNATPWRSLEWLTSKATVFTDAGKAWLTSKVDESVQTTGDYTGWGTGAGTAAASDTTLFTEDSAGSPTYARVSATRSVVTTTVTSDTVQWVASITSNGTKTIKNAGNFTASTSGTMIVKGDFADIALILNDIIQFTIKLQFT